LSRSVRLGIVGATGALGGEVLALLDASPLSIAALAPISSARSAGEAIDFRGESYAVRAESELRGLDLVICCAPPAVSLGFVREALRAEVPCIDASGALALSSEVPVAVAALGLSDALREAPLITSPPGAALALALVLQPIQRVAGITHAVATVLESAAGGGRDAIAALGAESVALFNQQDLPEPAVDGRALAFDCHPAVGEVEEAGSTAAEARLMHTLARVLDAPLPLSVGIARIPTFVGQAIALHLETRDALDPKQARELLQAAPGVSLWEQDAEGPNLRSVSGTSEVSVGRLRADPTRERALLCWLAADSLRLAAANAVALAERRLGL
jgi:aspartate-semialdehyde dehydrogenase